MGPEIRSLPRQDPVSSASDESPYGRVLGTPSPPCTWLLQLASPRGSLLGLSPREAGGVCLGTAVWIGHAGVGREGNPLVAGRARWIAGLLGPSGRMCRSPDFTQHPKPVPSRSVG